MIAGHRLLSKQMLLHCAAGILAACLTLANAHGSGQVEALRQTLENHGIEPSHDLADRAAFDALLGLVDPHAILLGTNAPPPAESGPGSPEIEEWPEGILYVRPGGFHGSNATAVIRRLGEWHSDSAAGVIVDVRDAGGEALADAAALAGVFVADGTALYDVHDGQDSIIETVRASRAATIPVLPPVMILIDDRTRRSSEVLAASLREHAGVMLIGSRSRGDAGLREVISLSNTQRVFVATRWVVPSTGDPYDRTGVDPHIEVADDGPRDANPPKPFKDGAEELVQRILNDPALSRATDVLLGLKALRKP